LREVKELNKRIRLNLDERLEVRWRVRLKTGDLIAKCKA
jgi:hypothetical protein